MLLQTEHENLYVNLDGSFIKIGYPYVTCIFSIPMAEKVIDAMQRLVNESKGIKFYPGEPVFLNLIQRDIEKKGISEQTIFSRFLFLLFLLPQAYMFLN